MGFQVADPQRRRAYDRSDHVWIRRLSGAWVCCLCGAIVEEGEPPSQGDKCWSPKRYIKLSEEDKARCPFDATSPRHVREDR